MPFCKNFNAKAVPCQGEKGECMAYPCNDWEQIMQTELDGTFYTEIRRARAMHFGGACRALRAAGRAAPRRWRGRTRIEA